MGHHARLARANEHEEQIQRYVEHGYPGSASSQANWHWRQLVELKRKASRSARDRDDVIAIQSIMDRVEPWLDKAALRDKAAEP